MFDKKFNFKISFHKKDKKCWYGSIDDERYYEILTDIILFYNGFMIINDLSNTYINLWDLSGIRNLKIELIEK